MLGYPPTPLTPAADWPTPLPPPPPPDPQKCSHLGYWNRPPLLVLHPLYQNHRGCMLLTKVLEKKLKTNAAPVILGKRSCNSPEFLWGRGCCTHKKPAKMGSLQTMFLFQ